MNGRVNSRRGSALLIVLGMLAFMVISAVAFSMFMRDNRLPSSFLRQKIVANHLVKAALANAMDEIDAAIGSHPYPGVTEKGQSRGGVEKNYWKNRIFMGQSGEGLEEWSDDTVSTLTLEALAYLPPPLINTARFWSRRTPTAKWQPLNYDAGRYAYTAINVSDYLDINRIKANAMRDSSSSNRVSFAYLFENDSHTGPASGASPEKFDEFIKKTKEDDFKTRLVSLADYNMAIASGKYGDIGFKSPFCNYFSGDGNGLLYSGVNVETIRRQQFVTDSWFPGQMTNDNSVVYLTEEQPFYGVPESLDEIQNSGGDPCYERLRRQMDVVSFGALYDYIDEDSVPISLAIPTIERTPMFTGLSVIASDFGIRMQRLDDDVLEQANEKPRKLLRAWTLKSIGNGTLLCDAQGVYPFKRASGRSEKTSYDVEVLVKCFFSSDDFQFNSARLPSGMSLRPTNKNEWKADPKLTAQRPWITLLGKGKATVKSKRESEEDCKVEISMSNIDIPNTVGEGLGLFGLEFREGEEETAQWNFNHSKVKEWLPYFNNNGKVTTVNKSGLPDNGLKLNFAFWFRIVDGDGKTVDLVPATLADDQTYNNFKSLYNEEDTGDVFCGSKEPVLPLQSTTILTADLEAIRSNIESPTPGLPDDDPTFGELMLFCGDPRYNFAPEDWYEADNFSWSEWLAKARARCNGDKGTPREIYQFVSDVGYLQSMGELQFLPATHKDPKQAFRKYPPQENAIATDCDYLKKPGKYNGSFASDEENTANAEYAWRTHWAFGKYADWASDVTRSPYMWGVKDTRDGAVVTPYSASDDLLMAGLANTPYDWTVAGYAADGEFTAAEGLKKYCFNGYNGSEAPFNWEDLCDVAAAMREDFLDGQGWDTDLSSSRRTTDNWNNDWYGQKGEFFGESNDEIDDNDRRYLYSFWKNCFGDRQQLFLVFVRAEPSVLGGNTGRTPSQLGARAVALVWREPVSSIATSGGSGVPAHRMRILFYHQFE